MIHYFIWNDISSRDMHVRVPNRTPVIRPEERTQQVTIPGRAGDMTLTEGEDVFNSYIQTIEIGIDGADNIRAAEQWLKGAGVVTFDCQPGLKQEARVYGNIELKKHSRNLDRWKGNIQFYCSPVKYATDEADVTVTSSGTTVTNPGDMVSCPLIEITGSGLVTVMIGSRTLTIPACESGWVIDTENEWILDDGVPVMGACSGDFPVLEKGANVITFTGSVSKLVITPRFRYL